MNKQERKQDLLRVIAKLDITPTMYKNAEEKYKNIATFLQSHGIEADMYPQGSFALGTVVRPSAKDPNAAYDLDFICQVKGTREETTPGELWKQIEEALTSSDLYRDKLTINERCFTIKYADVGEYGFSIDVVPATDESETTKSRLQQKSPTPELIATSISIPEHTETGYRWITNNPKGYRVWFERINEPFANYSWKTTRERIFRENRAIFASIEEIPSALNRSSVQRVIQILKHHRDVFYSKYRNGDDLKPISAIINTIVARMALNLQADFPVFDLLDYVTMELSAYAERQHFSEESFAKQHPGKNVIKRTDGKWIIENPANPGDNLADAWNDNPEIPKIFFMWSSRVHSDLIDSLGLEDEEFRARIEGAFGQKTIETVWEKKYNAIPATPILSARPAKPWGQV